MNYWSCNIGKRMMSEVFVCVSLTGFDYKVRIDLTSDPGADNITNDITASSPRLCTLVLTTRVMSYRVTSERDGG